MSFIKTCSIKFESSKKCFASFPKSWGDIKPDDVFVVESHTSGVKGYFSWSGVSHPGDYVAIDGMFGTKIGLKHDEHILVTKLTRSPESCRRIRVDPLSSHDWEILQSNCSFIESFLLFQIKVVWNGVVFPIWVPGGNLCFFVRVVQLEPQQRECLQLQELTEVIVGESAASSITQNGTSMSSIQEEGVLSKLNSVISSWVGGKTLSPVDHSLIRLPFEPTDEWFPTLKERGVRRIVFGRDGGLDCSGWINRIWIHENDHLTNCHDKTEVLLCHIKVLLSPTDLEVQANISKDLAAADVKSNQADESKYIETVVLLAVSSQCPSGHVIPCDSLIRQLGLKRHHRILLRGFKSLSVPYMTQCGIRHGHRIPICNEIKLSPLDASNLDMESVYQDMLRLLETQGNVVCTNGTLIRIGNRDFLTASESPFCLKKEFLSDIILQAPSLKLFKTSWGIFLPLNRIPNESSTVISSAVESVFVIEAEKLRCLLKSYIRKLPIVQSLQQNTPNAIASTLGCILINGPKGSGRDTLMNNEIQAFLTQPHLVYLKTIDCKIMRGKRLDSFEKVLNKEFAEVFYKRPSIIVLQDLDYLLPSFTPEEETTVEAIHVSRMALLLMKAVQKLEILSSCSDEGSNVAFVFTSRGEHHLHKSLFEFNFFTHSIQIPLPIKEQRIQLLNCFCHRYFKMTNFCSSDIEELASRTDGFSPADLCVVTEQVHHASLVSSSTANIDFFKQVLSTFTPSSLRGASLACKSNIKLSDIGGLGHVKQVIKETLYWPVKYPNLMNKCPIRPTSCLLLYGPPGTGKTLLAEAAANDVGINFISVEGPELLSKYIGASELAVRDLFSRARSAKPCIIFFDEFDSIAPRRGADSTGVTDRVVNQLLTQMDGVEGLDRGIFILAATSRPDLIDPALLRPGRFDKWLRCQLPAPEERVEILKLLLRDITVEEDHRLDWTKLSQLTSDFSGADLQSALFSAQVLAANRILSHNSNLGKESKLQSSNKIECHPSSGIDEKQIEVLLNNLGIKPCRNSEQDVEQATESCNQETRVALTVEEIMEGISSTKPSVSAMERVKFDLIATLNG